VLWKLIVGAAVGCLMVWVLLLAYLWAARPRGNALSQSLRLLPDTLRLVSRLARDDAVPRRVRLMLWLLLAYLASPIDLVPDFIPVLGYADDAIAVAVVLRAVIRQAGADPVSRNWPGSPEGLRVVLRLAGSPTA